jgi:hypothetical protein
MSGLTSMDLPPPYQEHAPHTNSCAAHGAPRPRSDKELTALSGSSKIKEPNSPLANIHSDRKAWLCPHHGIDFDEAKDLFSTIPMSDSLFRGRRIHQCKAKVCTTDYEQFFRKYPDEKGTIVHHLLSVVTLMRAPIGPSPQATSKGIFTLDRLVTGLHGLDIPVCPHIRLNQTFFLARFNPTCLWSKDAKTDHPCTCHGSQLSDRPLPPPSTVQTQGCKNTIRCLACRAQGINITIFLWTKESTCENGEKQVALKVTLVRRLGSLRIADDPAWIANTLKIPEFEYMAGIWQEQETHVQTLHREWFKPPFASTNPCSFTTGNSNQKDVPSLRASDTPMNVSDKRVSHLKKNVRKATVRCMKHLTKCFTEPFELTATQRASSKSTKFFKPWKSRKPGCLRSGGSHHHQVHSQRLPFLQASTGPSSSL